MFDFATVDFETYYDAEYSLSKLQTDEYCLDPRMQIIGVSVIPKRHDAPIWFSHHDPLEVKRFLEHHIDWPRAAVCAHHAQFDGFICSVLLGLKPKLWVDTLAMGRMLLPRLRSHSLAALAKHFDLPAKGGFVTSAIGKRLEHFTPASLAEYGVYCDHDTFLAQQLAIRMLPDVPPLELRLIDWTVRMFTEPKIEGDTAMLEQYYRDEVKRKEDLLARVSADKSVIMSADKLAAELQRLGAIVPTKISGRTGKTAYAFAKTDRAFTDMLEHHNPDVQALVAARLGVKSTIAETRALRLVNASKRGPMPVYLQHWGAKTTGRISGGDKMNWQNIPARGPAAVLRKAMKAPPGHKVVVGDSSNIELRMGMALAGEVEALASIAAGIDMYCEFATEFYGRVITAADAMERRLGKFAMLSCQYGTGAPRFMEMARMQGMPISEDEAVAVVNAYRKKFRRIADLWDYCGRNVLRAIRDMQLLTPVDTNAWFLTTEDGFSLPGMPGVVYTGLEHSMDSGWAYNSGRGIVKLHGAKVVENLTQHAARQVVMWQTARVHERYPVVLSVHDEIVCVVPEQDAAACEKHMQESLSLAPPWCRGAVVLKGETAVADTYGDAVH
jgi:hypothetical protein